ncbi:hypothetical protein [Streptomyces sp. NPDC001389]|uniref:hypothetical protein n=1 Tax=unclassified Streptomyces TaxID=2593676 RepID=UPI0036A7C067
MAFGLLDLLDEYWVTCEIRFANGVDRLDLPATTRHLAELRHVLAAGHKNHYRSPGVWDDAVRSCS